MKMFLGKNESKSCPVLLFGAAESRSASEKHNLKTGSSTILEVPSVTLVNCRPNQTPSTLFDKFGL